MGGSFGVGPAGGESRAADVERSHVPSNCEGAQKPTVSGPPQSHLPVASTGSDLPAVRSECRRAYALVVQHECRPAAGCTHEDASVPRCESGFAVLAEGGRGYTVAADVQDEPSVTRPRVVDDRVSVGRADDDPPPATVEGGRRDRCTRRQYETEMRVDQRRAKHVGDPRRSFETHGGQGELETANRIPPEVGQRVRRQLAGTRVLRLCPGVTALSKCKERDRGDDGKCDGCCDGDGQEPPLPSARHAALPLETTLQPPRLNGLDEHIVEDLVPIRSGDAVHDPIARESVEDGGDGCLGHVYVLRQVRRAEGDLRS